MNVQFAFESRRDQESLQAVGVEKDGGNVGDLQQRYVGSADIDSQGGCPSEYAELSWKMHAAHDRWDGSDDVADLPASALCPATRIQPPGTVLLVEHRDEVFARLAADCFQAGLRVVRATSACEALKLVGASRASLVVASVELVDQSGWLLAAKLRMFKPGVRIWLYQPVPLARDIGMAGHLEIDELFDYQGDLLKLSAQVRSRLAVDAHADGRSRLAGS